MIVNWFLIKRLSTKKKIDITPIMSNVKVILLISLEIGSVKPGC